MRQTYIAQVKAHDNYKLEVKIDYPGKSDGIVIFCHGSGPNTYDNPREIEGKHFNYFDLFADEFCRRSLLPLEHKGVRCVKSSPRLRGH